jgi:hypothetical protein
MQKNGTKANNGAILCAGYFRVTSYKVTSADSLMRMQLKYNMQIVWQDKALADRLAKIRKTAALL